MNDQVRESLVKLPIFRRENKRSLIFDCPKCGGDEKFYYEKSNGRGICYSVIKCGVKSNATESLHLLLGISRAEAKEKITEQHFPEMVERLAVQYQIDLHEKADGELSDADFDETPAVVVPTNPLKVFNKDVLLRPVKQSPEAQAYLASRGITDLDKCEAMGVYHHPVMNGIYAVVKMYELPEDANHGGQCRHYTPRYNGQKVSTAQGMEKGRVVYNYLEASKLPRVVLVEGIVDAIKAHQPSLGFGAVATFGKQITQEQIAIINGMRAMEIYIAFDRDAFDIVNRLAEALRSANKTVFRVLPPEHRKDIGECTDEEVAEIYGTAAPLDGVKLERLEVFLD